MKKTTSFFLIFLVFIVLVCGYVFYNYKLMEGRLKEYYTMEDFQDVKVGESTLHDVNQIAPRKELIATSYGWLYEYPMQDGKHICIKFYGPELIVGAIEIR